jgi:hypothetical protein
MMSDQQLETQLAYQTWMYHSISIIYFLCYVYDVSGSSEFDQFLALTNSSLFGGLMAFLLDNTVKGKYIIVINYIGIMDDTI